MQGFGASRGGEFQRAAAQREMENKRLVESARAMAQERWRQATVRAKAVTDYQKRADAQQKAIADARAEELKTKGAPQREFDITAARLRARKEAGPMPTSRQPTAGKWDFITEGDRAAMGRTEKAASDAKARLDRFEEGVANRTTLISAKDAQLRRATLQAEVARTESASTEASRRFLERKVRQIPRDPLKTAQAISEVVQLAQARGVMEQSLLVSLAQRVKLLGLHRDPAVDAELANAREAINVGR